MVVRQCAPDRYGGVMRRFAMLAFLAVLAAGCARSSTTTSPPTTDVSSSRVPLQLTEIGTANQPVGVIEHLPTNTRYVVERVGTIRNLADLQSDRRALDITDRTISGGERGLLGAAFSPDGAYLYVHYSDRNGDTVLDAFPFRNGSAEVAKRRQVLAVAQPAANHNGGALLFGPDGNLYLGLGDGGGQGDPDNYAQRLDTLLGKILRITPTPQASSAYMIPDNNPFRSTPGALPEIWVLGLRNPWRFSFDRVDRTLWIGDVGQNAWEEVDRVAFRDAGGANFGWRAFEGTHRFRGSVSGATPPIFEYSHDEGCSITGGYVLRDARIPSMEGVYLFGDYCSGDIRGLRSTDGVTREVSALGLRVNDLSSFGEGGDGVLYVCSLAGPIYRIDPTS